MKIPSITAFNVQKFHKKIVPILGLTSRLILKLIYEFEVNNYTYDSNGWCGLPVLYELLAVNLEINETVMHMTAGTGRTKVAE